MVKCIYTAKSSSWLNIPTISICTMDLSSLEDVETSMMVLLAGFVINLMKIHFYLLIILSTFFIFDISIFSIIPSDQRYFILVFSKSQIELLLSMPS
ncbi:Uncharacterised protein [Proteus mirabilis]|uniref:Uncharacterized protein n=1 Tax=Proteus mirabilis TaxID=584 RepID=A0A2X2BWY5_PROMI|nr:Uncharacterised protein [Proteus mirabilis]